MRLSFSIFTICLFTLFACAEKIIKQPSAKEEIEIAEKEPTVEYPIEYLQTNIETYYGNYKDSIQENSEGKYDSLRITLHSDSTYQFTYYREGRISHKSEDTVKIPSNTIELPRNQNDIDSTQPTQLDFILGRSHSKLYTVTIEGTPHKIIFTHSQCCPMMDQMGHICHSYDSYFSLEYGTILSYSDNMENPSYSRADWDQSIVNKILDIITENQMPIKLALEY